MKLKGQAKEDFEKWLDSIKEVVIKNTSTLCATFPYNFYQLSPSMKYGVYVDWFDSVGIQVNGTGWLMFTFSISYEDVSVKRIKGEAYNSRPEARTAAIQKANEIYNNIHK